MKYLIICNSQFRLPAFAGGGKWDGQFQRWMHHRRVDAPQKLAPLRSNPLVVLGGGGVFCRACRLD